MTSYSKDTRLAARHNWAEHGMSDVDNARALKLFKGSGEPNGNLIERWRRHSKTKGHKWYDENWEKYRESLVKARERTRKKVASESNKRRTQRMLAEREQFEDRALKAWTLFQKLALRELTPKTQRDEQTGREIQYVDPDQEFLKALDLASRVFRANAEQQYNFLRDFFSEHADTSGAPSWEELLEQKFESLNEILKDDPALSKDFFMASDADFEQRYLEHSPADEMMDGEEQDDEDEDDGDLE